MPNFITIFGYHVYFWSDEQQPLEPVHVHIQKGKPAANATKYWINEDGSIEQVHNHSQIPKSDLRKLEKTIEMYTDDIILQWEEYFGEPARFHNSSYARDEEDFGR